MKVAYLETKLNKKQALQQDVGQGRGDFEWLTEDGKPYFAEHSDTPEILIFDNKKYKYNGDRRCSLSKMKIVL